MTIKIYDPAKLSVVVGGIPITGFAEDTMFEIAFEDEQYKETFDNRGQMTRAKVNKNIATLTLYLMQNSSSNSVFSSFAEADRINDSGCFPIVIKDSNGDTIFACAAAFIQKIPDVSYGSEVNNREWSIRATNISKFI